MYLVNSQPLVVTKLYIVYRGILINMKKTTIKVSEETKQKLGKIKIHPRETYEDVILKLLKKVKG